MLKRWKPWDSRRCEAFEKIQMDMAILWHFISSLSMVKGLSITNITSFVPKDTQDHFARHFLTHESASANLTLICYIDQVFKLWVKSYCYSLFLHRTPVASQNPSGRKVSTPVTQPCFLGVENCKEKEAEDNALEASCSSVFLIIIITPFCHIQLMYRGIHSLPSFPTARVRGCRWDAVCFSHTQDLGWSLCWNHDLYSS